MCALTLSLPSGTRNSGWSGWSMRWIGLPCIDIATSPGRAVRPIAGVMGSLRKKWFTMLFNDINWVCIMRLNQEKFHWQVYFELKLPKTKGSEQYSISMMGWSFYNLFFLNKYSIHWNNSFQTYIITNKCTRTRYINLLGHNWGNTNNTTANISHS